MKTPSGIFLSIIFLLGFTLPKDSDKIVWNKDYKLCWNDFKGSPKNMDGIDAYTQSGIELQVDNNQCNVICSFDKKKSWRIKKKETDYLLSHEQYHFNICEIYARKLRKQIIELNLIHNQKELNKTFYLLLNESSKKQIIYDKDTKHSRNQEMQLKWEKDVDQQLQELNAFSESKIEYK
jgi:hypothetical protein